MAFLERIVTQGARVMAFGLGVLALLLDFTGLLTIAGGALALARGGYALMIPRGRSRRAALSLNAVAFAVAALVYLALFL